jgi:hypothetical protein
VRALRAERARGGEEAAHRHRVGRRVAQRVELPAGAHERAAERAAVEARDLVGLRGHEVVAEARVEVLDHRHRRRRRRRERRTAGERLQIRGDRHQVGVVEHAGLVHRTDLDPHLADVLIACRMTVQSLPFNTPLWLLPAKLWQPWQ